MNNLVWRRIRPTRDDATAQVLSELGVDGTSIYVDHGLTGTNHANQDRAKRWPQSGLGTLSW